MSYSQTWLEDEGRARGLLIVANVRIGLTETSVYLSSMPYVTTDGVVFNPIVAGDIEITESLDIGGGVDMTVGDIEVYNANGELDSWLDVTQYNWSNRAIQIYYGDPSWNYSLSQVTGGNFQKVYDGVVDDCRSRTRGRINLVLRDKLERLNVALTENVIGSGVGTWPAGQTNQDNIKPLIFGEVHNISPVLIDPATLKYQYNDGASELLVEIRDNGFPIYRETTDTSSASVDTINGTFNLIRPPAGTITCSVQGVKTTYSVTAQSAVASTFINTIPDTIYLLATTYGSTASGRFVNSEIDVNSFKTAVQVFSSAPSCGYYVGDRVNLLQAIRDLAASISYNVYCNRLGQLQMVRIGEYLNNTTASITDNDIVLGSLQVSNKTNIIASVKIAYAKNWTVQTSLNTFLNEQLKAELAQEWFIETTTSSSNVTAYKLSGDVPQKNTYLINQATALEECGKILSYYGQPRTVYSFTGRSKLLSLKLGDRVFLTHNRFGLSGGKIGQVIKCTPRWCKGLIDLEVIV